MEQVSFQGIRQVILLTAHLTCHPCIRSTLLPIYPVRTVSTWAGAAGQDGSTDGSGQSARFSSPQGIAIRADGVLFVADSLTVRKITPDGDVTTIAGLAYSPGDHDGAGSAARFMNPGALAVDPGGVVYVADGPVIRRISPEGDVTTFAGHRQYGPPMDGEGTAASFGRITGLDADASGTLYVVDESWGGSLRKVTPQGVVSTIATYVPGGADGVAVGRDAIYVCGMTIVRYAPDGTVAIVAGAMRTGSSSGTDDGVGAAARFSGSTSIAVAPSGTVFVVDSFYNAIRRGEPVPWPFPDSDADGLPNAWEDQLGLDAWLGAGDNGPTGDADHDGVTNAEEYARQSHPTGLASATRYFAEGATLAPLDTEFAVVNPGSSDAHVLLRFLRRDLGVMSTTVTVPASQQRSITASAVPGLDGREFSTVLESDQPVVASRRMAWPRGDPYGAHAERAQLAPAAQWDLAEGATHSGFDLFYLLQNPNDVEAQVRVTYLRPSDPPLEKTYTLPPRARANIWVNQEEFPGLGRALAATDVSAHLSTSDATPILVERAMYLSRPGRLFEAGHDAAGVPAPATAWFLAEGATGPYFDLFVLVANPAEAPAVVTLTYLRADGATYVRTLTAPPQSRTTVWVDGESFDGGQTFPLADTAVSTTVVSTNEVPIVVERAMWWPGDVGTWHEAHVSAGSTETAARWGIAGGSAEDAPHSDTYVLVANPADTAATVRVTLLFEDGTAPVSQTFAVQPHSRFNVDARAEFPAAAGRRFGALVESLGDVPVPIVVEGAVYNDAGGIRWAAGTNALATVVK